MAERRGGRWLTLDLLLRLMLPLLVIVVATAALGTYTAQRLTGRVYDRWLLDAARSVAEQVRFDEGRATLSLPQVAESILLFDENDRTHYSVSQGTRLVAGTAGIPLDGGDEWRSPPGAAYDATFAGEAVRVARVSVGAPAAPPVTVLVAETRHKRARSAQELVAVLWPMLALVAAAGLAIVLAVRGAVRPLQAIASRWNERSQRSLQPIDDADVPRELRPFTAALNDLLARIRALLARERQFAATAAHQLRTPLAGLQLGLARAARANDLEEARAVVAELSQSTERMTRIVQQLLALGRIDPEHRVDLGFVVADLVTLAEDVGAPFADHALAKHIDLELVAPVRPVMASVVPDLLAEALANVLDNALRYTPRGGRIVIDVLAGPPRLRVSDTGPGIRRRRARVGLRPLRARPHASRRRQRPRPRDRARDRHHPRRPCVGRGERVGRRQREHRSPGLTRATAGSSAPVGSRAPSVRCRSRPSQVGRGSAVNERLPQRTESAVRAFVVLISALALGACGGAGSSADSASTANVATTPAAPTLTLSGVAATGGPIAGRIFLKDSAGHEQLVDSSDGRFAFALAGLVPPLMLKAHWTAAGVTSTLYSFAATAGGGIVNITPLTHLAVVDAAGTSALDALYDSGSGASFAAIAAALPAATAAVQDAFAPRFAEAGVAAVDPFSTAFTPDHSGVDAVLDGLAIDYAGGLSPSTMPRAARSCSTARSAISRMR